MPKQREGGVEVKLMPSSDYDRHFLPTLSPYKSLSCVSQIYDRKDDGFNSLQQRESKVSPKCSQEAGAVPSDHKKTSNHERREDACNDSGGLSKSPPTDGNHPVAIQNNPESPDRKRDRKTQARRHLVDGLSTNHPRFKDPNRRSLYRSHTFNINDLTGTQGSQRPPITKQPLKGKAEIASVQKDNKRITFDKNCFPGPKGESQEKAKAAIEKWNELILELNSNQHANKSRLNHLSVLSDSSSSDDLSPLPTYGKSSFLSSKSLGTATTQSVSIISNSKLVGLGFTRYRPITPNLLEKLDKLKVSSRKRTQRWINQIQVQRRSYNGKTRVVEETNNCVDQAAVTRDNDSGNTSPMDTLKPLKRTESYGSSNTRQSCFLHVKNPQAEFL